LLRQTDIKGNWKEKWILKVLIISVLFFVIQPLSAQFYNGSQLSFGKNRVQYQKQNWEYYRTTQFDVYFYPTGKELAEYVLWKAPTEIDEIEKMLNYTSTKKILPSTAKTHPL